MNTIKDPDQGSGAKLGRLYMGVQGAPFRGYSIKAEILGMGSPARWHPPTKDSTVSFRRCWRAVSLDLGVQGEDEVREVGRRQTRGL